MKDYSNYHISRKEKIVHDANKLFDINSDGLSGQLVRVNDEFETKLIVNDKYSMSQSLKNVFSKQNVIKHGDILKLEDDSHYLVILLENENKVTKKWIAKKCNIVLKWVDDDGLVQSTTCILEYNTRSNFGIDEDRLMTLPDGRRQLTLQFNDINKSIVKREKRFLIGGQGYKVIDCDDLSDEGLINLSLTSAQINPATDNLELGIADYYNSIATYDISILNGEINNISINQELQLNVEVLKNGSVVEKTVIFESDNEDIILIDQNGLVTAVSTGTANIIVSSVGITKSISIVVHETPQNNFTVEILGLDYVNFGLKRTYEAVFKNNGQVIEDDAIFSLTGDDGVSTTTLATFKVLDTKRVEITGNSNSKMGYIILHVDSVNNLIQGTRRIQIKGFL